MCYSLLFFNKYFHHFQYLLILVNKIGNVCPEVFSKRGVLKIFAKFKRKHLCWSLFFNKVAGLRLAILLKKRLRSKCIPVSFTKTLFLYNTSGGCFCKCICIPISRSSSNIGVQAWIATATVNAPTFLKNVKHTLRSFFTEVSQSKRIFRGVFNTHWKI